MGTPENGERSLNCSLTAVTCWGSKCPSGSVIARELCGMDHPLQIHGARRSDDNHIVQHRLHIFPQPMTACSELLHHYVQLGLRRPLVTVGLLPEWEHPSDCTPWIVMGRDSERTYWNTYHLFMVTLCHVRRVIVHAPPFYEPHQVGQGPYVPRALMFRSCPAWKFEQVQVIAQLEYDGIHYVSAWCLVRETGVSFLSDYSTVPRNFLLVLPMFAQYSVERCKKYFTGRYRYVHVFGCAGYKLCVSPKCRLKLSVWIVSESQF